MKVAVLSGKGGTGKTFVAVNLAVSAGKATYIDCDVEEPNGRVFLRPEAVTSKEVCVPLPEPDVAKCDGCRKCVTFCRFHALVYLKGKPRVFPDVCHGCGGCAMVCPQSAIREIGRPVGTVECGYRGALRVITGQLQMGEASAVPVIRAALRAGADDEGLTVIDCPPGSACPVMECVAQADRCIVVVEPTAFGLHNFQMVRELTALLQKPCAVIVNRTSESYAPLEAYLQSTGLPVLARIPFRRELAELGAAGRLACEEDAQAKAMFSALAAQMGGERRR